MHHMLLAAEKFSFPFYVYVLVSAFVALAYHTLRGVAVADSVQGVAERFFLILLASIVLTVIESYL